MLHSATTLPPGIEGSWSHISSDSNDQAVWMPFGQRKYYTNAFIVCDGKLLLGYKKRGFGRFKYNGFGGKVEEGEISLEAASRELAEEAGITAPLVHAGCLLFLTEGSDQAFHIDIYRAEQYSGTITETDEMRPQWFSLSEDTNLPPIPWDEMWETDRYWLHLLISKKPFTGRADFKRDGEVFTPHKWWFGLASS